MMSSIFIIGGGKMVAEEFLEYLEEDYADDYVIGLQNPTQLISSLALLLRERNYACLYDTSILTSPEQYLKKNSLEALNKDFLYKWFLFYNGILRNINNFSNLILLPEVIEECSNLLQAVISALTKRKNQFKTLSPQEKKNLQDIFEQLLKNEEIIGAFLAKLGELDQRQTPVHNKIFEKILDLVKLLNEYMELKKLSSRRANDTDERIAARALYEIIINQSNVAVYTRDDDVRKLISTAFRLLISRQISEDCAYSFLKNFSHFNLLVLKYNYEKKSYSRFFESSTLPHTGDFRFPRKLPQAKVSQLLNQIQEILADIDTEIVKIQSVTEDTEAQKEDRRHELISEALVQIFESLSALEIVDDAHNNQLKISLLKNMEILVKSLNYQELEAKIRQAMVEQQRSCIENILDSLHSEKEELQQKFNDLSSRAGEGIEYWQKVQSAAASIQQNLLKMRFFQTAANWHFYQAGYEDFETFKELLNTFQSHGFHINAEETPIPAEKIAHITGYSTSEIIKLVDSYNIRCENSNIYLTQDNVVFFTRLNKTRKNQDTQTINTGGERAR